MRIVLTRLDRVGDCVLSTPAIASVRRSWPAAHVTMVCSAYNQVVVAGSPDVDELIAVEPTERPANVGRRFRGICDLAIALAPCHQDFALVGATRAPIRVGYTYVRRYFARLFAPLYVNRLAVSEADPALCDRPGARPVRHEADQVLDLVRLAGGREIVPNLRIPITDADREAVAAVPRDAITLHLGARWFSRGSSFASVVELTAAMRALESPLVVTHGSDAVAEARELAEREPHAHHVGDLPFGQWAAIFEKSRLVVTVDTGATHVASAVRRPTVVLFEHAHFNLSSQEWSPYRVPARCLRKPDSDEPHALAASRAEIVAAIHELLNIS